MRSNHPHSRPAGSGVQILLGAVFALLSLALIFAAIAWGVLAIGNSKYHDCLQKNDASYPEIRPDVDWPPDTNAASQACADKNFLPESLLG